MLMSSTPAVMFPAPSAVKLPASTMNAPVWVAVPVRLKAYLPLRIALPDDPVVPPPEAPPAPLLGTELLPLPAHPLRTTVASTAQKRTGAKNVRFTAVRALVTRLFEVLIVP